MNTIARALACLLFACSACTEARKAPAPEPPPVKAPPAPSTTPAPPTAAASLDHDALLRGELPEGSERALLRARCQSCHTLEYVTQQRLSEAQWDKALSKMQKWGSQLTNDEKNTLAPFLASTWPRDLPDRRSPRVTAPGPLGRTAQ